MKAEDIADIMRKERICVIVPTYNNGGTIVDVLTRIRRYTHQVIVVCDGCTDDTHDRIAEAGLDDLVVVEYEKNRGKGVALKNGFAKAILKGYEYAITIDADGQHLPEDIPLFINAFKSNKHTFIVGARDNTGRAMRPGSAFAKRLSNFWFYFQTGTHLKDTRCGYRLYPLSMLDAAWFITSRFEAELEFLVFAAWKGIRLISLPVHVYYPPDELAVSNFRPIRDFLRITLANIVLSIEAVTIYLPGRLMHRRHK